MEDDRNKKNTRLNLLSRLKVTSASQTSDDAKIIINNDIAILKLTELAKLYVGITNPQGFLTDLRVALGIPDSRGASKYGYVVIPKKDGSYLQASLRITNHNSNVKTYIDCEQAFMKTRLESLLRTARRCRTLKPQNL